MAQESELKSVREALVELHRLVLLAAKKDQERITGKVLNPSEWFQILVSALEYSWLKPLNSLLSDVDALTEMKQITELDLAIVQAELERFFFKEDDEVTSFNSHYRRLFAHNPDVVFAHGRLKEAFSRLPVKTPPPNVDEIRLGWHKIGASKRKLLN